VNVGLKIDFSAIDYYKVFGRGELHIAILLENMRREGFELQVSQPQVIIKEIDGAKHEPFEEVTIDTPQESCGIIIEKISRRKGQMLEMRPEQNHTRLVFLIPTRGLLGYRNEFIVDTRGQGILCAEMIGFKPYVGEIEKNTTGSMVSGETGKALAYSLANLQERGSLYIGSNTEVYDGQVIGNTSKGLDMVVNPIKGKNLTNMRASNADIAIQLTPPMEISLERGLEMMAEDEYLEITPKNIRLRKRILTETDRIRAARKK
jgi:GTP-binding protein